MRAQRWQAQGPDGVNDLEFVDIELPEPGPGEVLLRVEAAGINPADLKHAARAGGYPWPLGYEVAGVIEAIGPGAELASGGGAVGDPVLAFRVRGGFGTALVAPARDVFARPATLSVDSAATLLLAATTAADMLDRVGVTAADTVLITGASGAVGLAAIQLARQTGARVVGVSGEYGRAQVEAGGALWVAYGAVVAVPVTAALDTSGSDEAVDLCLSAVADRSRIVTVAAPARAASEGFIALAGSQPESAAFRDSVRAGLIALAAAGELVIPVAQAYPLAEARVALDVVAAGRAGGKVVLHA